MVARPRETDDEHLLAAANEVLMREGPARFTLAKAASRAGVSAATLVKRFGSRQAMFRRLSQRWIDAIEPGIADAVAPHASPVDRLRAAALWGYIDLDNPSTSASQLAALAIDLQNDDLRELLGIGWGRTQDRLAGLIEEAIGSGDLTHCPPAAQTARIIFGVLEGSALDWSVRPEGSLVARLADDLDALLDRWI